MSFFFFLSSRACALDVSKFCRDVPHGSGQQLKCLSNIMQEDSKFKLEAKCDNMLKQRLQMFDMALKVVPINGVQDLWVHVSHSIYKFYLPHITAGQKIKKSSRKKLVTSNKSIFFS